MRNFVLALLFLPSLVFGDAVIFSGSNVRTLKPNIDLFGQSKIMSGSVDPSAVATAANPGSLYLNSTTGALYRKTDSGLSTNWLQVAGTGDVVGPASATANAVALYDGTTGKLLKNSTITSGATDTYITGGNLHLESTFGLYFNGATNDSYGIGKDIGPWTSTNIAGSETSLIFEGGASNGLAIGDSNGVLAVEIGPNGKAWFANGVAVAGSTSVSTLNASGNIVGAGTLSITGNVGIGGTVVSGDWQGGTIGVGKGGTGLTAGTSGGVPYFSSTSTIASSGALTANTLVLGGGAGAAPTSLGAGTTTTVLHGNAAGAPTFAAVSLTADVTGVLGTANGGTAGGRIVSANISGGSSVAQQFVGAWINSVTNNSTGDSTLNITSTGNIPHCVCTVLNDSNPNSRWCKIRSTTATAIRVFTATTTDTAAAENYHIICQWPQ